MPDRIEIIYKAIDQMAEAHGTPKPEKFGGGTWGFNEEIARWKIQVVEKERLARREPLTPLQWSVIDSYIEIKRKELIR
jgi:hypothetical protein